MGFLRSGVLGLGSSFLLWTGLYAGALRLRLCFCFQVGGVLCTITESQPLRSVRRRRRRRSSYVRTLNRSIETGAQFRPCLCLLGASPTISLLLTSVSRPSLVDIQQCVSAMPAEALKYLGAPRWRAALSMFPGFTLPGSPDQAWVLYSTGQESLET